MPVKCLPQDKPKILFYGAMMAIQNYGFYEMYYPLFLAVPDTTECSSMRYWLGFFALDCFVESFCCLWMAMGGYVEDPCWFAFGWLLHLFVALPYCLCSVVIPYIIYNGDGAVCRESHMGIYGKTLEPVVWIHVSLFMVYVRVPGPARDRLLRPCRDASARAPTFPFDHAARALRQVWMMLSITWYSFLKPTFCK